MDAPRLNAYLQRIGIDAAVPVSPEGLEWLHVAHLLNIPFENLDIFLGRPARLDEAALLDKLLVARRGGFCYELNHAFALLLGTLGFEVGLLSARVYDDAGYGPAFDHLLLRVHFAEGDYLADVGFGDNFIRPLGLSGDVSLQDGICYRLVREDSERVLQRRLAGGGWIPLYRFEPDVFHDIGAFAPMCHFHQHSPDSLFTHKPLCSQARTDGRVTLSGRRLIASVGADRLEQPIGNAEALRNLLCKHFGIALNDADSARLFAAG
jgi:N-hydroxyarylamine O-acetyltransferase